MDEDRYSEDGKVHDSQRLKELQILPLWRKIQITQARIMEWYNYYEGQVYISFSGGKDSTVLLDLVRRVFPDIEAVFVDTGLEYPEIREFVQTFENVTWIKPKIRFDEVIKKYGYPLISKNVSEAIYQCRGNPHGNRASRFDSNSDYCKKYGKAYDLSKWIWLKDSDIPISHMCCNVMKKSPCKLFEKKNNKHPIVGTMTIESALRRTSWLKTGCNAFDSSRPISQPISFWTEQDVLEYIDTYKIPYASVYGDIIKDKKEKYSTTGLNRTGCIFCGFGIQTEKSPNRFERLKETHPKMWDYCIRPVEENGLGMGTVLDYINVPYGKEDIN